MFIVFQIFQSLFVTSRQLPATEGCWPYIKKVSGFQNAFFSLDFNKMETFVNMKSTGSTVLQNMHLPVGAHWH